MEKPPPIHRLHASETVFLLLNWSVIKGQFDLYRPLHILCALEKAEAVSLIFFPVFGYSDLSFLILDQSNKIMFDLTHAEASHLCKCESVCMCVVCVECEWCMGVPVCVCE